MFQQRSKARIKHALAALVCLVPGLVQAQGSTPYLGQVLYVGFNFAPQGWATCDGQTLAISTNTALFALLGTTYGGNGTSTFQLPDLRGRMPIHQGTNSLGGSYLMGQEGGAESHTVSVSEMPSHAHAVNFSSPILGNSGIATSAVPGGHSLGNTGRNLGYATSSPNVSLGGNVAVSGGSSGLAGGNQPFSLQQPYLTVTCVIALAGVFPTQN
jgi:microcystin-dependent protein